MLQICPAHASPFYRSKWLHSASVGACPCPSSVVPSRRCVADMGHMKKWRKSLQVQLDAVHQQELGHWLDKHHPVPKPYGPTCALLLAPCIAH